MDPRRFRVHVLINCLAGNVPTVSVGLEQDIQTQFSRGRMPWAINFWCMILLNALLDCRVAVDLPQW